MIIGDSESTMAAACRLVVAELRTMELRTQECVFEGDRIEGTSLFSGIDSKNELTPALSTILPAECRCVEVVGEIAEPEVFPEEANTIRNLTPARRQEFLTGRACARRALSNLGLPAGAIPRGRDRDPLWPSGIVGSITHCTGYRAAAVAQSRHIQGIGIDAEPNERLDRDILRVIAIEKEFAELECLPGACCWDRLLFSAKESVFKAWFPLTRRWLDFYDVNVKFSPETHSFRAFICLTNTAGSLTERYLIEGTFVARKDILVSAVTIGANRGLVSQDLPRR
jgi:4'-phosphopantetheinyl transferase EntD